LLQELAVLHENRHVPALARQQRQVAKALPSTTIMSARLPGAMLPVYPAMRSKFAARPVAEALTSWAGKNRPPEGDADLSRKVQRCKTPRDSWHSSEFGHALFSG